MDFDKDTHLQTVDTPASEDVHSCFNCIFGFRIVKVWRSLSIRSIAERSTVSMHMIYYLCIWCFYLVRLGDKLSFGLKFVCNAALFLWSTVNRKKTYTHTFERMPRCPLLTGKKTYTQVCTVQYKCSMQCTWQVRAVEETTSRKR